MSKPSSSINKKRAKRKIRELAFILPALGIFFFLTPFINTIITSDTSTDIRELFYYIFTAWALLILGAYGLSRKLTNEEDKE
ncbi:MAG: hypothetical protein JJ964_04180 [Rhizobiales bacterium]|nr:hypothetical protein [Hyphomicrobiales bacterium]